MGEILRQPLSRSASEVHLWCAALDRGDWPDAGGLPVEERRRAERILSPARRRLWIASRWALRTALASYLDEPPATIELHAGRRGKPQLAAADAVHFNLSHSAQVAVVAVTADREVGVDVERIGDRPRAFYEAWTRREAVAKCFGGGLGEPPPEAPVEVSHLDLGEGWATALALAGAGAMPVRRFELGPG